ncbi:hypothetical protein BWGOE13_09190 [Bacillus mycoides]|nr:hypothetical protein BWGOE1_08860 [Bacillus mycoides]OFE03364.1 hypothetical protein BWGOE13_09190 [Bacillus mycoides]CAH2461701.1 Integrase [Bacillus mycoides KBAB4]
MSNIFGYWFYKQTKDVAMLQDILNHITPQITLKYIGINKEEKDNVLDTFLI